MLTEWAWWGRGSLKQDEMKITQNMSVISKAHGVCQGMWTTTTVYNQNTGSSV
jgi:hypothetical protein